MTYKHDLPPDIDGITGVSKFDRPIPHPASVYVLLFHVDPDTTSIEGIYTTREAAEAHASYMGGYPLREEEHEGEHDYWTIETHALLVEPRRIVA